MGRTDWLPHSFLPSSFLSHSIFLHSRHIQYSVEAMSSMWDSLASRLIKAFFSLIYYRESTIIIRRCCCKLLARSSKVHELKKNTNFRYLSIGNLSPSSAAALLQQLDTLWCFSSYIVSLFQLGCDCPKGRIFTGLHNSPMYLQSIAELSSVSLVEDHNLHTLFQSGCDCARGKI